QKLSYIAPVICNGETLAEMPEEILVEGAKEWEHALVGFFIGKKNTFRSLHSILNKKWSSVAKFSIHTADNGIFIFKYESEASRDWILNNGPWDVWGVHLALRLWERDMPPINIGFAKIPVWVKLMNIPMEYWTIQVLRRLVSVLGTPLHMDPTMEGKQLISFARKCVEMKADKEFPEVIKTRRMNGALVEVKVEYSWRTPVCDRCKVFDHSTRVLSSCATAKEMWDRLEVTYEGTNQVKDAKINMLVREYEMFSMKEIENISGMFVRFTNIINSLQSLNKCYTNSDMVRKILRCLPKSWMPKVTAIEEAKDLNTLPLEELLGSLMTHEMTIKNHEDDEEQDKKKKKVIAFKPSTTDSSEEDSDDEMALITRRFKKYLAKKKFGNKHFKKTLPSKSETKKEEIICFECNKPVHYKTKSLILKYNIAFLGILEMRVRAANTDKVARKIGRGWRVAKNHSQSLLGRIWILWNPSVLQFTVEHISHQAIHGKMIFQEAEVYVSVVYGSCDYRERRDLWANLVHLSERLKSTPWVIFGDFNVSRSPNEHSGGRPVLSKAMREFGECIKKCELEDLRQAGCFFSWSNKRAGVEAVSKKLDRAMGNWGFKEFNHVQALFPTPGISDHSPCIIQFKKARLSGSRPFKYLNILVSHPDFLDAVRQVWSQTMEDTPLEAVGKKLRMLKPVLKEFHRRHFNSLATECMKVK
ncbi:LOW QUALITY PROTEIN: Exo_endo_phos domain-containing protein/DUF4283 domain-containing protein/UBN2 domain-containing protein, partial [Cephalotus follicularis]